MADIRDSILAAESRAKYTSYVKNPDPSFMDYAYGRIRETGMANAGRWLVLILPNQNVRDAIGMDFVPDTARLATTCKSVVPSEQGWMSYEESKVNAGPLRIFPYRRNTNNSSGMRFQFNCGTDMFEKEFIEFWMRYIQNPVTRQMKFYDTFAKDSEIYIILLPNHVQNFNMAMEAMYQNKLVGMKLTEVYPFSFNINGGSLNYTSTSEPLFIDVSFMYHDIVPLNQIVVDVDKLPYTNTIPTITDSGYPVISKDRYSSILNESQGTLDRAVNGFALRNIKERARFNMVRQNQDMMLQMYVQQLEEYKQRDIPTAVDGRVVYSTPKEGGLNLALTSMSQVQGFFGAGFYGNGWYP
jgi:hypothetical protein